MLTTRRGFLQLIGVVAAGCYVEPERVAKVFDMGARPHRRVRPQIFMRGEHGGFHLLMPHPNMGFLWNAGV